MMALVTLATAGAALVQSGSVGAVTAYHHAPALGVIAGVCSAGISEPTTAWDLEQFGMHEDLIPSQNALQEERQCARLGPAQSHRRRVPPG